MEHVLQFIGRLKAISIPLELEGIDTLIVMLALLAFIKLTRGWMG